MPKGAKARRSAAAAAEVAAAEPAAAFSSQICKDDAELQDLLAKLEEMQTSLIEPTAGANGWGAGAEAGSEGQPGLLAWLAAGVVTLAVAAAVLLQNGPVYGHVYQSGAPAGRPLAPSPSPPPLCRPAPASPESDCRPQGTAAGGRALQFHLFGTPPSALPHPHTHTPTHPRSTRQTRKHTHTHTDGRATTTAAATTTHHHCSGRPAWISQQPR